MGGDNLVLTCEGLLTVADFGGSVFGWCLLLVAREWLG